MKQKNGFTLIEMLGVIILLGILVSVAIGSYSRYLVQSQAKAFKIEELSFKTTFF